MPSKKTQSARDREDEKPLKCMQLPDLPDIETSPPSSSGENSAAAAAAAMIAEMAAQRSVRELLQQAKQILQSNREFADEESLKLLESVAQLAASLGGEHGKKLQKAILDFVAFERTLLADKLDQRVILWLDRLLSRPVVLYLLSKLL